MLFASADFNTLKHEDLDELASEIPVAILGKSIIQILCDTKTASSNGDARRLILSGAVSVNGEKISQDKVIEIVSLIKKGKNSFILVK